VRSLPTPTETDLRRGYETRDISLRALVVFAALIAALIAGSMGGLWVLWKFYQRSFAGTTTRTSQVFDRDQIPPPPQLQNTPARDYDEFRREQEAELNRYRWIDREQGIVQIPISRAMDLALEKGVGSLSREGGDQSKEDLPRKTPDRLAPPSEEGQP
jgi:hypothetical protein